MATIVVPRRKKKSAPPPCGLVTFADVSARLGGVPLERIRLSPPPGSATVRDVADLLEREGVLCELVDGVLVEKAVGWEEARLGGALVRHMNNLVIPENRGVVLGADGASEIQIALVRIPDTSFFKWERLPNRRGPKDPIPRVVPNLAAEILSRSNTRAEMKRKRRECFEAGVELFWEFDPKKRIVRVYTAPETFTTLTAEDTLDGGTVLPGFELPLDEFFGELDRHG